AVDVERELAMGVVADAHRRRAAITGEVIERELGQAVAAVDAVDDLWRAAAGTSLAAARLEPAHEGARLVGEADAQQAVDGERSVADPAIAIVPVARAADRLGQAARR